MWGEILTAVGAAGEGALDAYSWQQGQQQQRDDRASRERIAKLNADIRNQMIEAGLIKNDANIESREKIAGGNNATRKEIADATNFTRTNIATMVEGGRDGRHDRASGNTVVNNAGATDRTRMTITARDMWNRMSDATRRRGQDAAVRGQDVARDVAMARDGTTRRGQDLGAAATRRGQDLRGTGGAAGRGLPPLDTPEMIAEAEAAAAGVPGRSGLPVAGYGDRGVTSTRPEDVELASPVPLPRRAVPDRPWRTSEESSPDAGPSMRDIVDLRSQGAEARAAIDRFASTPYAEDLARGISSAGVWPKPDGGRVASETQTDAGGDQRRAAVVAQLRSAIDAVRAERTPEERKRATETLRRLRGDVQR